MNRGWEERGSTGSSGNCVQCADKGGPGGRHDCLGLARPGGQVERSLDFSLWPAGSHRRV